MKMKYSLKTLWKNLKILSKYNLEDIEYNLEKKIYDNIPYENDVYKDDMLLILDYWETINLLTNQPKSFCRFGDGEIDIIDGKSIPFQEYDDKLADILGRILKENNNDLYVGINYNYFHSTTKLNEFNRRFYIKNSNKLRDRFLKYCNRDRTYIAAGFNQLYTTHDDFDFDSFYRMVKLLFKDRDLVIFAGESVFKDIQYDVFEMARSKKIFFEKSKNAFDDYDIILKKCLYEDCDKTLLFILGPCSKALVYELTKQGRIAWDIGHLAKDYDWYMKKRKKNTQSITEFYQQD